MGEETKGEEEVKKEEEEEEEAEEGEELFASKEAWHPGHPPQPPGWALSLPPDAQHQGVLGIQSSNRGGRGFHPCSLFCSHEAFFLLTPFLAGASGLLGSAFVSETSQIPWAHL